MDLRPQFVEFVKKLTQSLDDELNNLHSSNNYRNLIVSTLNNYDYLLSHSEQFNLSTIVLGVCKSQGSIIYLFNQKKYKQSDMLSNPVDSFSNLIKNGHFIQLHLR